LLAGSLQRATEYVALQVLKGPTFRSGVCVEANESEAQGVSLVLKGL